MCPMSAFRKIWDVDGDANIITNAHTCLDIGADMNTVQEHHKPFYSFGLCTGHEIRFESSLAMSNYTLLVYMFHMSKVTPECMPPTRGDFGHDPFLNSKGSLDINSTYTWVCCTFVITMPPSK